MIHKSLLKIRPERPGKKFVTFVFLSLVFIILLGITFWGVQWFSNSLDSLLIHKSFAPASLQIPIENADASMQSPESVGQSANLLPLRNWDVSDLQLDGQAAISMEVDGDTTKILFNKNEGKRLPIASLTKLMTAAIILDHYDLSQTIVISPQVMSQEGEQGNLQVGQVFTIKDLLYVMLMESSNRAAYALAEYIGTQQFVDAMNSYSQNMGLSSTHFSDMSGLDSGSYSSARDLAVLTRYLFDKYPLFRQIVGSKEYSLRLADGTFHHAMENTNELLGQENIVGGKTGFTNDAKGCLMTIETNPQQGDYIINVLLGSDDRFKEMQNIIQWINTAYRWR